MRVLFGQFIVVFLYVFSGAVFAAEQPKKIAEVEGITEYQLDNGIRLLLFPDNSNKTVTVNITYFVGSNHEGRGEKGMAHLLEHMLFKGTKEHKDIWKLLEERGAQFNGTTWLDRTNYYETLPTTAAGNLEFALKLEADRMINSLIAEEDLQKEFSVVRNEFEMSENSPISVMLSRIVSTAFIWHNYGNSTIGSRSDIERVPATNLRAFYQKYYQPDNAMLVIAGDFQTAEALTLIMKYFGSIARPTRKLDETYTIEPTQDGARFVELSRVGDVAACGLVYHTCAAAHPDYAALSVLEEILTDEPAGKLYKALVETEMATRVQGYPFGLREPGILFFGAEVRTDKSVNDVLHKMTDMLEGIDEKNIDNSDVDRAKRSILKNIELSFKDSARIGISLTEYAARGDWRLFFLFRDTVEKINKDAVVRVAKYYLKPSNRTAGIFSPTKGPDRTEIPTTPNIEQLVQNYKGGEAIAQGEEFDPTPDNVEKRVKRLTLANGMKLALLPKETRGDAVKAVITLRIAAEKDLRGKTELASLIPEMLERGTSKFSYQQIQDRFDELKADVGFYGGGDFSGGMGDQCNVSISTDRQHLNDVIQFIGTILQDAAFPESEFETVKRQQLAQIEKQISQPQALAFIEMFRGFNPYPQDSIHYVPTLQEAIERIKAMQREQMVDFYKNYYGASFAQMTVVGDFDMETTKQTIEKTFGNWKSPKPHERVVKAYKANMAGEKTINTPDKPMAMVATGLNVELSMDDPNYPAMHFANYMFGASANSRLNNKLRQEAGLSYGAFSFVNADRMERQGFFASGAICASPNAQKAMALMLAQWTDISKNGFSAEEINDAKEAFALDTKGKWADDSFVANVLTQGLYFGRTSEFQKKLYQNIADLTPEQIHTAWKTYVKPDNFYSVTAGDLQTVQAVEASGTKAD